MKSILFWDKREESYLEDFFNETKSTKKYLFRYLTVWYYLLKFSEAGIGNSEDELKYYRLFIVNYSHTREVGDQPLANIKSLLEFVDGLLEPSLITAQINKIYSKYDADIIKLMATNEPFYDFIHRLYFDFKLQELLEGRNDILFKLSNVELNSDFDISRVENVIKIIKKIFFIGNDGNIKTNLASKLVRKYILTYFDYGTPSGYSYKRQKYNLINDNRAWLNRVINTADFNSIIQEWLSNEDYTLTEQFTYRKGLFTDEFDWRYYFVNYKKVLEHAKENHFIGNGELADTILINKINQSSLDCYLPIKLLEYLKVEGVNFRQHLLKTAYLDLVKSGTQIVSATGVIPRIAIDLIYQTMGNWHLSVFYKDMEDHSLGGILGSKGFIKQDNGRWRKKGFYQNEESISLKQNLEELTKKIQELVNALDYDGLIPTK